MRKFLAAAIILLGVRLAVTAATCTWSGANSTNWDSALNWDTLPISGNGDDVIIPTGMPRYPSTGVDGTFASLTIDTGASVTVTGAMTITGDVNLTGTLTANANLTINGNVNLTGTLTADTIALTVGGDFNCTGGTYSTSGGTLNLAGDLVRTGGSLTFTGTGASGLLVFNGGAAQAFNPTGSTFRNVTVSNSGGATITASAGFTMRALDLANGTLDIGAQAVSVTGNITQTGGSITSTGTLTLSGAIALTADLSTSTLANLTVSNTVGVTLQAAASLSGTLSVTGILATGGNVLTVGGAVGVTGTLDLGGAGTFTVGGNLSFGALSNAAGSTLVLNGGGAQAITPAGQTFGAVQKTGAGTTNLLGTATFASLSVTGGTFTLGGATATSLTVNGNLANSATFNLNSTAAAGTVLLSMAAGTSINNTGGTFRVSSSTANVTLSSPGTTTLSGNEIDLNSRTLRIGGFSTNVLHTLNGANDTLVLTGSATFSGGLTLSGAGSQVQVGTQTLTVTGLTVTTGTVTVSTGSIAAGASAVNTGASGAVTFSGAGSMSSGAVTNAGSITLAGGTASTGTVNNSGTVTFGTAAGASWTVTGNFTSSGTVTNTVANTLSVSGNLAVSGTFNTPGNSTITMTGAGTTVNTAVQVGNLTTGGAATVTATGNALNLAGALTVGTGTSVSLAGLGATITGAATGAGTGTLNGGTAGVTINGDFTIPNYQATSGTTSLGGAVVTLSTFGHNNGTVQLTRNGAQGLTTNVQSFNNLTVTNSGTDTTTVTGALTVLGNLDVQANQTLAVGNNVLSVTGTTGNAGTITLGTAAATLTGAVTNSGTISRTGGSTIASGAVTNTGTISFTVTAGASWTVTGNFTSSGTVTNTVANTLSVSGNLAVSGTFNTPGNSTITMTGAGTTVNTAVQVGNLTTGGAATVTATGNALNLAGALTVGTGTSVSLAGLGATITGAATGAGTGTLNGGTAGVTINGDFTIPNYQATSGTTSLGGAVVTLSTFGHNNGTVQLTRNGAQGLTTNVQSFNNLTVTNSGTDTTTVTGALTVLGNLDVQANQTLAVGNNVLSVTGTTGNAGTITLGTAAATLTGAVTNTGVLTGGSGTLILTAGISGGTFTASSGTTNVRGTFAPATFNHNTGSAFLFDGGAAQSFGAYTFNNLEISNAAGVSVSAAPVTVAGTLTLTSGTLSAAGFALSVTGTLDFAGGFVTSSGTVTVSGDIVRSGGGLSSTGSLVLSGTAAQALDFSGSALSTLSVTKTGGTATAGSDFSVASYSQTGVGGIFSLPAARTMTVTASTTVTAGTLGLAGSYAGGGAGFAVNGLNGTVTVGTNAFVTGAMIVSSGTFSQTGVNGGANTVASLSVSGGTCTWDAGLNGGTLTISGLCSQSGGTLAFNLKNVTLGTGFSGSIEFYDLVIPAGVTLTPLVGSTITVRRSMTIQNTGNYSIANNPTLVLGGASSVAAGTYTDNNAVKVNLGTVTVSGGFSKTLSTALTATDLTIAGGPLVAGAQTLTVTGNLNLNSGSVTSSGTVSVAGNFAAAGGTLASTGTLEFTGGAAQSFNPTGSTFSTISINKTGGSLTASASFSSTNLTTAAAAYAVTIAGGTVTNTVTFSNTGALTITNGFIFDGGAAATAPASQSFAGTIQATGANDLDFGGSATTITANAVLRTTGVGTVTLAGVTVNAGATLTLGNGAATTVNAGAVDGTATSGIVINTTGVVTISGALGSTAMNTVTVTQSGGTTFQSTLNATTVTASNTAGTIDFQDAVTIGTLNTAAQGYNVRFGNGGTITNAVTFSNTGTLTIPNGLTFNGGATATQGPKSIEGTITTSNDALDFGVSNVTLTDATTLSTGTGNITLGPTTSAGFDLVLQGSGADTIASAALGAGTLNLTGKTGGSVTVTGSLTAQALTTVGAACAVSLNGGGTVTNLTTFSISGALTLGNDAGDSLTFTGGVTALLPSGINVAGTVATGLGAGQNISLGDGDTGVVLSDTSILSAGAGNITLGGTVNGNPGLTLNSTGSTTLSAAIGGITPLASLTTNAVGTTALNGGSLRTTGPMTFGDAVTLGADTILNSGGGVILFSTTFNAGNHDLILAAGIAAGTTTFTGAVSNLGDGFGPALTVSNGVTGLVRFSNTLAGASGIQAANAGNQVRFDGNVTLGNGDTGTSIAAVLFDGLNFSGWGGLSFGATSLSGAAVSVTSNGSSVTFATIDGAQNLGINAGAAGTISVTGAVGASTPPGTITITQSNGTTFSGNVNAAALTVSDTQAGQTVLVLGNLVLSGGNLFASGPTAYHVSLTGAVNSISGSSTFDNTGNLTLGDADADSFTFTGGLTATLTNTNWIRGTIATGGGAGQNLVFDTFTMAGVTTLNAGANGNLVFSAPVTVPDFAAATDLSVTADLVSAPGTSLTIQDGARVNILNSSSITLNTLALAGANSIMDLGSSGFTIGTLSNLGTLRLTGLQATHAFTTFDTDSGITEYYGTGAGSLVFTTGFAGGTYWDLRIASSGAGVHTLQNPVTVNNDLHIAAGGVLDVSGANHLLTVNGNWRNDEGDAGFVSRSGTVDFNKSTGTIEIRGNNTWYVFQVLSAAPGLEVHFENDLAGAGIQIRQKISVGGIFRVRGSNLANTIRLDRLTDTGIDPGNPPADPGDDIHFWFLDLTPGATLDMQYVEVYYSNARSNPISVPANVSATPYSTYFSFKWLDYLYLIYSYTEDSDYNGKIDRIRVTAEGAIGTLVPGPVSDFSDFLVEVDGYEVDVSKGVNGYERPVPGVTFYIHLVEKPYLDTDTTPDWRIVRNETLFDTTSGIKRVGTLSRAGGSDWMTPSDTAWPVIGYTLSVPAFGDTFVHFSEPVVQTGGGTLVAGDFGAGSFARVSGTAPQTREAVVGLGPYTVAALAAGATNLTVTATTRDLGSPPYWEGAYNGQIIGPPPPTYPDPATGYLADPNTYGSFGSPGPNPGPMTRPAFQLDRGGENIHRVSDLLVSVPPSDTPTAWSYSGGANANSFFVWPLWAKDSAYVPGVPDVDYPTIPELDASGQYVGFVRLFDGSRFLRDQDFDLQAEDALGLASAPQILYKSDVPAAYLSAVPGIWLPTFAEPDFSGLASYSFAGFSTNSGAGSSPIWDYSFLASDTEIYDRARFEFYFRLPGPYPADLYAGRLDMDPDAAALPADWFRRVRPFGIYIRDLVTQKGGVTILNNVIDPIGGERVRLHYTIGQAGPVTITVFTLDGDVVRSLQRGTMTPGDYTASWDGRNRSGDPVARGMYFIRIVAPGIDEIRKVLVVRY